MTELPAEKEQSRVPRRRASSWACAIAVGIILAIPVAGVSLIAQPGILGSTALGIALCIALEVLGMMVAYMIRGIGASVGFVWGYMLCFTVVVFATSSLDIIYLEYFGLGVWLFLSAVIGMLTMAGCVWVDARIISMHSLSKAGGATGEQSVVVGE